VANQVDAFVIPLMIGWVLAILSLIVLNLGTGPIQKIPVFHGIAALSALAYLYTGSIVAAGLMGLLVPFLQELMARLIYNHGSSHIDPPAAAIAVGTLIMNLLFKPEFLNLTQFFK